MSDSRLDKNKRTIGRSSTISMALQNTTNDPATTILTPLGAVTTKSITIDGNTVEANDSFNATGLTESQLTSSNISISIAGNYVTDTDQYPNYMFIDELVDLRLAAALDPTLSVSPVALVEYKRDDRTLTAYMLVGNVQVDDNDSELSTWTADLTIASAPLYPPTYTKTPKA